jgi:protein-tyrosine phosphatase
MIDLHAHVLPGIDDGPEDMTEALAMARVATETGTTRIVATPHLREDHPEVRIDELGGRIEELNQALIREDIALEVVPGAEVDLLMALELSDEHLHAVTLGANGSDLLIETPVVPLPSSFEGLLEQVRDRGYRIVLAHPELSPSFIVDPDRLGRLVESGILLQITARSLRPPKGSASRALAFRAVQLDWAHVLASDGHSATWRPPRLGAEVAEAVKHRPELAKRLAWMTGEAPAAILAGAVIPMAPVAAPAGGGLLRALSRSKRRTWGTRGQR